VDPLSGIVRYKSVLPDPSSQQAIEVINSWVANCATSHSLCNSSNGDCVPTRLIDVGSKAQPLAQLVTTGGNEWQAHLGNDPPHYIALSYCWGPREKNLSAPTFATTSSTIKAHQQALPTEQLPQTLLDAIQLTRDLGIRYLWADSLCIIQGDDETAREDWYKESSMMAAVYGGAWLTIVASWGESMHAGLFTNRDSAETTIANEIGLKSLSDDARKGVVRLVTEHAPLIESMDEPLYCRGWALQERILSKRVVVFNRDQFIWECQCDCFTESGFKMRGISAMRMDQAFYDSMSTDARAFQDTWHCIVTDYSGKYLTNPSDKFPAIAGLARRFYQLRPNDLYIAGLWKETLIDGLIWVHQDVDYSGRRAPRGKPSSYRAPSWSWAALDGGIRWMFSDQYTRAGNVHAELVDHHIDLKSSDDFGEVNEGTYIILKAPLWKLPEMMKQFILDPNHEEALYELNRVMESGYIRYLKDRVRQDVHAQGLKLAEVMGQAEVEATDVFILEIIHNVSLILSSPKLKKAESAPNIGVTRCYKRLL
jgi:hypothetical protein